MDDEVLARDSPLVGVVVTRVDERLLEALAVDRYRRLVGMLFDDREEVAEQPLLGRGQFGMRRAGPRDRMIELIDTRSGGRNQRHRSTARSVSRRADARGPLGPGPAQPAC